MGGRDSRRPLWETRGGGGPLGGPGIKSPKDYVNITIYGVLGTEPPWEMRETKRGETYRLSVHVAVRICGAA